MKLLDETIFLAFYSQKLVASITYHCILKILSFSTEVETLHNFSDDSSKIAFSHVH